MNIMRTADASNPETAGSTPAHYKCGEPTTTRLRRNDWKGWLALAWVLWWGSAYAVTVLEARAPQSLVWLRSWTASHG